jgi:hypothetical protein
LLALTFRPFPFYHQVRERLGLCDHPPDLPWQLARLYRATIYLAAGADYLDDLMRTEGRSVRATVDAAPKLARGIELAERELTDLSWAWTSLRNGRPVAWMGKLWPNPLEAALVGAKSVLTAHAYVLTPGGLPCPPDLRSWRQNWSHLWRRSLDLAGRFPGVYPAIAAYVGTPTEGPEALVTEAQQDLARVWLLGRTGLGEERSQERLALPGPVQPGKARLEESVGPELRERLRRAHEELGASLGLVEGQTRLRLVLDAATFTITLDGVLYRGVDPVAFTIFRTIWEASPRPVSGPELEKRPFLRGKKFGRELQKLPDVLRRLVIGTPGQGYHIQLTPGCP